MEIRINIPEKKDDSHLKRMDLLEKRLDQQYKSIIERGFSDKKEFNKQLSQIQQSFLKSLEKISSLNTGLLENINSKQIKEIRSGLNAQIKILKDNKNEEVFKSISESVNKLEEAIKNISLNPKVKVVRVNSDKLSESLGFAFKRIEDAIRASRPKLIPCPS